jgi:hypothetical protein
MAAITPRTTPEPQLRPPEIPSAAPLCAMWQGRCGRPAHLIVDALVPIGDGWEPLSWLCCDDLRCLTAAQTHAECHGLRHVDTRRLTPADGLVTA